MAIERPWQHVDVPFSSSLHDVTRSKGTVYAVGDSGTVLQRSGGTWTTLLDRGPTGNSNVLKSVGITKQGKRVWFAGSSGTVGVYDVKTEEVTDFSNPEGESDQWNDMLVTGKAGSEVVRLADNNGEIVTLTISGTSAESTNLVKPRSAGQSITGLARSAQGRLFAVNTSGKLFWSSDGQNWSVTDLADTDLVDVATDAGRVYAITSSGFGFTYDPQKDDVSRFGTEVSATHTIDAQEKITIAGTNGMVADLVEGEWQTVETPASTDLYSVTAGAEDLAVGSSGTVISRKQKETK